MKILSHFLIVSILILSCITCEDTIELKTIDQVQFSFNSVNKNQNHTSSDSCSPLCTCNCCGQTLLFNLKSIALKTLKPVSRTKKAIEYRRYFSSDYHQSIWQPPKLNTECNG
ncbi:DUF6660 family protein [Pedobacter jamesrossensis]|uniref:DUF6660 family protein n=1 Tax=Pedobacter jamesrossensis TaxID=1908238 RepID=A0ABV8NL56_9SPHI